MGLIIFALAALFLLFFTIFSALMAVGVNFKFKDSYNDQDLIYNPDLPEYFRLQTSKQNINPSSTEKREESETRRRKSLLIDMHTHTRVSDGLLTPKQLILWHISNGYDGLVISDHNSMDAVLELLEIAKKEFPNFIIIPGMEFTSLRVHLNIIGGIDLIQPGNLEKFNEFKRKMVLPKLLWTTKRTIKKFINYAHENGFLVQFNHKNWYPHKYYLPFEWYVKNGIDGWEIYNGFDFSDPEGMKKVMEFNQNPGSFALKSDRDNSVVSNKKLFLSAGTDVHDPAKHLRAYTEVFIPESQTQFQSQSQSQSQSQPQTQSQNQSQNQFQSTRTLNSSEQILYEIMESLKRGNTKVHYFREEEFNRERPERGKRIKNTDRDAYIRKWFLLLLPAYALSSKKYRRFALILYLIILILALIL